MDNNTSTGMNIAELAGGSDSGLAFAV